MSALRRTLIDWPVPTEASIVELGQVAQVRSGYAFKSSEWSSSGIPVVKIANVKSGRLEMAGCSFIPSDIAKEAGDFNLSAGDILIAMTGYIGDVARVLDTDLPVVLNQRVGKFILKDKTRLNDDYLFQFLRWSETRRAIEALGYGSAQPNVSPSLIHGIEIPLPAIEEQREIASILGALDDKIELNRRMNGTLEALAQAVFKEWFVEKAEEGWEETSLAAQVEVAKGLSYKGSGLADAGRPMHNLNSIYEFGRYKYEGIKWYTGEFKERHLCKAGDVIVANTEQGFDHLLIGSAAIVPKRFGDEGLFTHHIYRVRPLPTSYLTNHFLYLLLSHPAVREQVQGYTNGTTVNSLAKEGLERPTFKLPPKALVEKFDAVVAPLFARQEANYEETQTLTALRDTLLPKLMRGEVRVKVKQYT